MSSSPLNQNGDCVDHITLGQLLSSDNVDSGEANLVHILSDCDDDASEEHEVRVGYEYQAVLPLSTQETNHMPYSVDEQHPPSQFAWGSYIPVTWIKCRKHEGPESISDSEHQNFNNVDEMGINGNGGIEGRRRCCFKGFTVVPGLPSASWSDAEKASFLLALYIFEKNFAEVRRFVETKHVGAILNYYYGGFHESDEYLKWCVGRKSSKKSVHGQKIFSGLRLQELLSRLFQRVAEECKNGVLEVCKTFAEDKMSFVDYITTLKALVGTNTLVEAIGIGKGKKDITRMVLEPPKSNHTTHARPEIPAGKACSSLTTTEIVKFLSGDYRLSKARSNDLFWEAVWPRLLARGWHSEQPENQGYIGGSKFLVFLMPGIKKFSRRKLVKGDDYFDSITDVLSKVAKEPELIELEDEEAEGNKKDEQNSTKLENNQPAKQRHFYLQPRTPSRSLDAVKFTIVDTSLSGGNVRELRTLPSQVPNTVISHSHHEDDDSDDTTDIPTIIVDVSDAETLTIAKADGKSSVLKNKELNNNKKPRKVTKTLSRKQKQGTADNIAPMSKRCKRFTANANEETRGGPTLENGTSRCSSDVYESNGNFPTQISSWHDKLSSTSSSKGSPCGSIEPSQPHLLIDLNWPTPEFENETLATNSMNEPADQPISQEKNQSLPSSSVVEARNEEQAVVNPRRLSTRYRPPTTRTLEAVASGFLSVSRRRKNKDASSSRPSQRSRRGVGPNESPSSSVASHVEEAERGTLNNSHQANNDSHSRQ
ncbi:hypothetical protein ACS0TY_023094 [Phlomoides rotata]